MLKIREMAKERIKAYVNAEVGRQLHEKAEEIETLRNHSLFPTLLN